MLDLFRKILLLVAGLLLPLLAFIARSGQDLSSRPYLQVVQECIGADLANESKIPKYLYGYILNLSDSDYAGHHYESEYLGITFHSQLKSEKYVLNLYFRLDNLSDCKMISVYEVLN